MMTSTAAERQTCQWGYNALGHEVLVHHCGQDVCPNLREITCGFCGERTDALVGCRGRCARCGSVVFGGALTMSNEQVTTAQPRKRTVRDSYGDPCLAAQPDDYPLRAQCDNCEVSIECADGTADWFHIGTRRGQCADRLGTVR